MAMALIPSDDFDMRNYPHHSVKSTLYGLLLSTMGVFPMGETSKTTG
jgi:hypothetical protein